MANQITFLNTRPTDGLVDVTSRYTNSAVIRYGDVNRLSFSIYKRQITEFQSTDQVTVIPSGMEYRPDLVSQRTYGTPNFWWRIMEVNKIFDVFDFKSGVTIRLPQNIF